GPAPDRRGGVPSAPVLSRPPSSSPPPLVPKQACSLGAGRIPAAAPGDKTSTAPLARWPLDTPESVTHACDPFLGLAPARIEASGPRLPGTGLSRSAAGAAPPRPGTGRPPTGSIAAAGTPAAARRAPPATAAAPPPAGTS